MFRFTIRDLLWLTVMAALAVGWWINWRSFEAQSRKWEIEREQREMVIDHLQRLVIAPRQGVSDAAWLPDGPATDPD